MDIRLLVERIEHALGPNATEEQVEKLARLFINRSNGAGTSHQSSLSDVSKQSSDHLLVFAHGRDRVGILAAIATELADLGCSVIDVEQSVSGEQFMLMMRASTGAKNVSAGAAQSALDKIAERQHIGIVVQHADLYDAMNRV